MPSRSTLWASAAPALALLTIRNGVDGGLNCGRSHEIVGDAVAITRGMQSSPPNVARQRRLTEVARTVQGNRLSLSEVAVALRRAGTREVGDLSSFDRYWLATAWWAFHQPSNHLKTPDWAPSVASDPDLALRHPEGGNCESSSNAHAALLRDLDIPSRTVYGKWLPSGEGHVWTISDVEGYPLAADVHVARATEDERMGVVAWNPPPKLVQTVASYSGASTFLHIHRPENPALSGLSQ